MRWSGVLGAGWGRLLSGRTLSHRSNLSSGDLIIHYSSPLHRGKVRKPALLEGDNWGTQTLTHAWARSVWTHTPMLQWDALSEWAEQVLSNTLDQGWATAWIPPERSSHL